MPVTSNETEIRRWAARRGAHPVEHLPYTHDGEPAQLGFVFGDPAQARDNLRPISWEQFFAMFRLLELVLRYDADHDYELLKVEPPLGPHDGAFPGSR